MDAIEDKIKAIGSVLETELENEVDEYEIDLSEDYPEPSYVLKLSGVGTFPRGDIQAIKAKSKNGKSFLCSVFIASILGCKDFSFESLESDPVVLYFDTEQNKRNTAKLASRVHTLLGWDTECNHKGFHAYSLRTMDKNKRFPYIQRKVSECKPTVVFIDGIADLIGNFNDIDQSDSIIESLMSLSGNNDCCVCCVLHTNKAKDDSGMKGHLGTLLLQKSSDVFEAKKNKDTVNVSQTECRNAPIEDFAFSVDKHGIPYPTATKAEIKGQQKVEAIKRILKDVFAGNSELSFTDLVKSYALHGVVSESTAKRAIREAKENNLIRVTEKGNYAMS